MSDDESFPLAPCLPSYLAEIFGEIYAEDGLVVMGKGLQSEMLLASLIRFYGDTTEEGHWKLEQSSKERPPLVMVLGMHKESERSSLLDILTSWGTREMPVILTSADSPAKERASLYRRGGVFVITSRILIVDLLTSVVESSQIDGVIMANAEQVKETSTEAFILRIIQSQRPELAFVKAVSAAPETLAGDFAKVQKVMKALYVRKLYLYPRFHANIREELEGLNPPRVTELHQQLSPLQKEMQAAIAAAVQSCLREIKASTPLIQYEPGELTIESLVTMDRTVSRQLEKDWHNLTPKTKQLVQDLRTMRTLFQSLLLYDCVSFYKLLHSLKSMSAASRYPSLWLLTPAADCLFRKAQERVYTIHRPSPTDEVPNPIAQCQPILEENPKWRLLRQVLTEVREQSQGGPILVLVQDDRTLATVRDYLVQGKRTLMLRWLNYLEEYNDRSRSNHRSALSEESRLLLQEEGRARRILFGHEAKRSAATKKANDKEKRKRRRIAVEKGRNHPQADDMSQKAALQEAVDAAVPSVDESVQLPGFDKRFTVSCSTDELRVVLKSYSSMDLPQLLLLQDLKPRQILLYDTDIAFVRSIEVYAALLSEPVHVHFLMFEASAEEKAFLRSLEREQNAFERLILHKKTMPPLVLQSATLTQEMQQQVGGGDSYMDGTLPLSLDSRKAKKNKKDKRDIAVDVREFRSALPSILHQGGMRLAPVTLTVGDFVLSNVHCVERKSISDLFGSFASGRLYTQAEAMCKHYKVPCLLIEFDPNKTFCLQNAGELGVEIKSDSICSKMAVLTMHFPQLRILWSRSPHETLRIFRELKQNHEEVDVERALEIGRNEDTEDTLLRSEEEDDEINEAARDMLLRMPGVNIHSARRIMENCDSLAELSEMSRQELRELAGPVTGQKLFTFFRQKITAAGV